MTTGQGASELALDLGDGNNAVKATAFPPDPESVQHPGLYSWWVDEAGAEHLSTTLGEPLSGLIYAGQAGASTSRAAKASAATLYSRIRGQHLGGNVRSSTFRMTLTALLRVPLQLELVAPKRLSPQSNERVTDWIRGHLAIVTVVCLDRATLRSVEQSVLHLLDPPLNLEGMNASTIRTTLTGLRRGLSVGDPQR